MGQAWRVRTLAWQHQRTVYDLMSHCAWETVRTFTANDRQLQGRAGAITVLHTHSRRLDYHPHVVHLMMPAATLDPSRQLWRTKPGRKGQGGYLFSHKALAKVYRAKLLDGLARAGLASPSACPRPGWWMANPSAAVRKLSSISGSICTAA